ncbi:LPP20 family lipoprotein [Marinomonas atlantica]|uniref:LPP20 family lipoprotein n=1 Tax=Marinomonas atlantica TaxID=1806668 RepID=UPI00082D9876|nr:LPP20 family lipoprotein [Marinomonas atlantica]MCO4787313.1 LPP20 family lipoprotein [Marinomonas atlantica]
MNLKGNLLTVVCTATLLLSGCVTTQPRTPICTSTSPCVDGMASVAGNPVAVQQPHDIEIIDVVPREPIVINATGYSSPISNKSMSKSQARLMTMRGSKLDAYRNLSERVYGISLDGTSSLSNMMIEHDQLRTYVNAYLVGAKVISQRELEDGTFETVVELALQENFRQCASSPESIRSNPNCQLRKRNATSNTMTTPKKQPSSFYSVQ